jgi:hypothetical protein
MDETKPSETKPKKMVRRSLAIALGIVCILLIASLGGAMAYYTLTINDKNSKIDSINAQLAAITGNNTNTNATEIINQLNANITNLTNEKNQLQAWLDGNETLLSQTQKWLSGNITSHESQISTLNARITQLQTWLNGNITAYNSLSSQNTNLQNQVNDLTDTLNLGKSTAWVNDQTISQSAGAYTSWTESVSYAGYVSVWVQTSSVPGTHVRAIYSAYGVNFNQEIIVNAGETAVFPILPSSSIQIWVGNGNQGFQGGATETVTITYHY